MKEPEQSMRTAPMIYGALEDFLQTGKPILAKGPVALIFAEDEVEIGTTLRHHLNCGFTSVVALMPDAFDVPWSCGWSYNPRHRRP